MSGSTGRSSIKQNGKKVHPSIVAEKSVVSSFLYEVLPLQNAQTYEDKEQVLWMKFEQCDINDLSKYKDSITTEGGVVPLLLLIGYARGVQGWLVSASGVAEEVFSWRQGTVKTLKILPTPQTSPTVIDKFSLKRPIYAIVEDSTGPSSHTVSFFSFKVDDPVDMINFSATVQSIEANKSVVVVSFADKLAVLSAGSLQNLFIISECYPNPDHNPFALGDHWIAYADNKLHPAHQSIGGCVGDQGTTVSTVLDMVKNVKTAIYDFSSGKDKNMRKAKQIKATPGVVTIVCTDKVQENEVNVGQGLTSGLIGHFEAHRSRVACMQFNISGLLLATADVTGRSFNVFSVDVNPHSYTDTRIQHQYVLYRGDTEATILDMSFSLDSRWMAVSSQRGTTHVYAINPYGGKVCWRTHKTPYVLNKLTGFERTNGSQALGVGAGSNSPRLSKSPGPGKAFDGGNPSAQDVLLQPILLQPHTQIKQANRTLLESLGQSGYTSAFGGKSPANVQDEAITITTQFGAPRGHVSSQMDKSQNLGCLYVAACHGNMVSYLLQPRVHHNFPKGKDNTEADISLTVNANVQWSLLREKASAELTAPLPPESSLLKLQCTPQRRSSISPARTLEEDQEDAWIAQVEIHTHVGPHRRIWMGPQFIFVNEAENAKSQPRHIGRSSPMDVPIANTRRPVVIEAHSFTGQMSPLSFDYSSVSVDSIEHDAAFNRLKSQLAEAIDDESGQDASNDSGIHNDPFDTADLMDISCRPPGPNISGRRTPTTPRAAQHEDTFQSITPKLTTVVIASSSPACPELQPFWGKRTPSLDECRGLTSSAEELSSALRDPSPWQPIEPSLGRASAENRALEKPKAVVADHVADSETFDTVSLSDHQDATAAQWSRSMDMNQLLPLVDAAEAKHVKCVPSGSTSEDESSVVKETKKDRKKKKKNKAHKTPDAPPVVVACPQQAGVWVSHKRGHVVTTEPKCDSFPTTDDLFNDPLCQDENGNQDDHSDDSITLPNAHTTSEPAPPPVPKRRLPATPPKKDDESTTSGDDRKTTSESDVTASPKVSPTASTKKSKRKKKNK